MRLLVCLMDINDFFIQNKDQTLLFSARFTSLSVTFRFKITQSLIWFGGYKAAIYYFMEKNIAHCPGLTRQVCSRDKGKVSDV